MFPGGVVILAEIFDVLDVKEMRIAEGAMREGLLYDMLGPLHRTRTRATAPCAACSSAITSILRRPSGSRPRCCEFLEQTREAWQLEAPLADLALQWAARLHEIGLDVSHSGYHRHGAYLLENADMPGFPARRAAAAGAPGRRPPPQAGARGPRGAGSAVGPQRACT